MDLGLKGVRVAVLGGGVSCERDISLLSAHAAVAAMKRHAIDAVLIDVKSRDKETLKQALIALRIDVVFIALHGEFGEDGGIQTYLEDFDVPFTGSAPHASYLAMDKIASKKVFEQACIPIAKYSVLLKKSPQNNLESYSCPVVVKPYCAGSSLGVSIVKEKACLQEAIDKAFAIQDKILIEDYIDGREFTVGILEERALSVVEIIPKHEYFDFDTKYSDGQAEFRAPAEIPEELTEILKGMALKAHQALGCRHFSRVDMRLDREGNPFVLEVNSIPGLTSHSLLPLSASSCGIPFDGLILKMLLLACHEKKYIQKD